MSLRRLCSIGLALAATSGVLGAASELQANPGGLADVVVTFSIENVNRSQVPCESNGLPYKVRGNLVAPASIFAGGGPSAVTLYAHGSADADIWHLRVDGHPYADHVTEMARLGHPSLALHMLGYGPSDVPPGFELCVGSQADVLNQVTEALKTGSYDAGPRRAPQFDRVAVAGHSAGGIYAQVDAYSFDSVDALVLVDWADGSARPLFRLAAQRALEFGMRCETTGGEPKRRGAAGGYGFVFQEGDKSATFNDVDPAVFEAVAARWERDYCGLARSAHTLLIDQALVRRSTSPSCCCVRSTVVSVSKDALHTAHGSSGVTT